MNFMIISIDSDIIRIGPISELLDSLDFWNKGFCGGFRLPLFSTSPTIVTPEDIEEDSLCFVIRRFTFERVFCGKLPLEIVEKINKTWNEFYEKDTR